MKQAVSLLLALCLLLGLLTGCAPQEGTTNTTQPPITQPTEEPTDAPLEKVSQRVYRSGPFSEGLAVVVLGSRNGRACVINTAGEILFDLPVALTGSHEVANAKFVNGLLAIRNGICDRNGNMTMPQDVGAHKFFTTALAGGFIPALINPAADGSTGAQIGILNAQMEWVVAPSEALYANLCNDQGKLLLQNDAEVQYETERNFYFQGYLLIAGMDHWLELSTGNLIAYEETGLEYPAHSWFSTTANDYWDRAGNIRLDLSRHKNREQWTFFPFLNGLSILLLNDPHNDDTPYSFAMIDEQGNLFFDPITLPCRENPTLKWNSAFQWDANHILVTFPQNDEGLLAHIYDKTGQLIAQLDDNRMQEICNENGIICATYEIVYNDGVLVITGQESSTRATCAWYFTPDLTPLF